MKDVAPANSTPIPQPKENLFLGNLLDVDAGQATQSLRRLAHLYGPIYQLRLRDVFVVVSSQELVHFVSDEDKFEKFIGAALREVRNFAGDGLFTAFTGEHNWTLAHRILIPAFGPLAIKKMQGMMLDIIVQMLLSWEHHAGEPFEAADQYTRLTFDTIGWCAFRYRFNSFHTSAVHPFIDIMVKLLSESGARGRRPTALKAIMYRAESDYKANIAELHKQCDEIVAARRRNPEPDAHDLLNNMILDKDPKTGEHLSDDNIRYQMVTFLIAGHETTSGMLSFATYYMLKNPRVFVKAREEADKVIAEAGGNLLKINPASLTYIDAICKETLRLQPSAPAWAVTPKSEDGITLPGGYFIPHGRSIGVLLHELHRDPKAWGPDAQDFRPERFLDGTSMLPDSWKPFGNGARGCIGRGFAIQEAVIALALIVGRFDLEMADPTYDLTIKQTLTIKPDKFNIVARPRLGKNQSLLQDLLSSGGLGTQSSSTDSTKNDSAAAGGATSPAKSRLYFLYGSNSGSCEGLARELASEGSSKGFDTAIGELDSVAGSGHLPTDGPVIICTASYEGKPTDNARMFVEAISNLSDPKANKGVSYIVFGAGHHDWATTFHKIPKLIDSKLEQLGAERLIPISTADAGGDIVGDFEAFKDKIWSFFKTTGGDTGVKSPVVAPEQLRVRVLPPTANPASTLISAGLDGIGTVVSQTVLVQPSPERAQKNHITIRLPEDQTYRSGDYLAVLPKNPPMTVRRALDYFNLQPDSNVVLSLTSSFLPSNAPLRAEDLLASFVELGQPVSKKCLSELVALCQDEKDKAKVQGMVDDYVGTVTAKRISLLDILESVGSCQCPLDCFLENLPKMKIRQYSISSTPLEDPSVVSLTYTVHSAPSQSGVGPFLGVASNYLAFLKAGDSLPCSVKSSAEFHPPSDPSTPIVMFAAGTGMAPFRGFILERALQKKAGRNFGPTVLFYGCRDEDDILHRDELVEWVRDGVLDFRPVLSRSNATSLAAFATLSTTLVPGTRYVQHRVWEERDTIRDMFRLGSQFYTCGSGAKLAADLRKAVVNIIKETKQCSEAEAEDVFEHLSNDRYRTDVFL